MQGPSSGRTCRRYPRSDLSSDAPGGPADGNRVPGPVSLSRRQQHLPCNACRYRSRAETATDAVVATPVVAAIGVGATCADAVEGEPRGPLRGEPGLESATERVSMALGTDSVPMRAASPFATPPTTAIAVGPLLGRASSLGSLDLTVGPPTISRKRTSSLASSKSSSQGKPFSYEDPSGHKSPGGAMSSKEEHDKLIIMPVAKPNSMKPFRATAKSSSSSSSRRHA
mmetsp:Transcript_110831/g.277414  ORF Transcript_110831/g.277414 Transcript_110831/m.277414 type:complete len:227 (+) Transcript_110831:116-796(+)